MFESTVLHEKTEGKTDMYGRDEMSVIDDSHLSAFTKHWTDTKK